LEPHDESAPAYQVVILGGGPAGCATALALRRRGVAGILVVEAGDYGAIRVGESIPPDARLLLGRLGVWPAFLEQGHEPCLGSCSAWGGDALGYNDFLFNPHGNGWHLDRRRFDAFLARQVAASGAEFSAGTRFSGAERAGAGGFTLRLAASDGSARTVGARFVVDATGSRSRFARLMGARWRFHDRLSYVAAFLAAPADVSRLTMLEATEYGWWYAARLPGDRLTVGAASDPEIIKGAGLHAPERWLAHLEATRYLSRELAGCDFSVQCTLARVAPSFVLDRACGPGWLAVGDAAAAYDPISSQGIYKALFDGLQAAEAIAAWLGGDAGPLHDYHASIAARFADYLRNRNYFYQLEQRWPAAPFWRRRRERTAAR
jgi:flavin-dependent dehydrogenase